MGLMKPMRLMKPMKPMKNNSAKSGMMKRWKNVRLKSIFHWKNSKKEVSEVFENWGKKL
jgi:hypothetical protein